MLWCLLVLSLPTHNATARMRAWRALKACGAAVLRDGVYALPDEPHHRAQLHNVAGNVGANGGTANVLVGAASDEALEPLFDRSAEFSALVAQVRSLAADPRALPRRSRHAPPAGSSTSSAPSTSFPVKRSVRRPRR